MNTDKRVKVTSIKSRDDFADIPEGKLIEFMRSAGAISNDVRKILEEKLGTSGNTPLGSAAELEFGARNRILVQQSNRV